MIPKRFIAAAAAVAAAALVSAGVAQPASAAAGGPAGPATGSIWAVQATVNPQAKAAGPTDTTLASVSASGPDEAWAVGTFENQQAINVPLAEHWNGTTWTRVHVTDPAPAQGATLSGVDDLSPDNAWAVGTRNGLTLIEHWNGTAWSVVPSPNPATGIPGDGDILTSISGTGPDDLWAAGDEVNEATMTITMLFEHWNGTKWSAVDTLTLSGDALAITAVSPGNVWAVGEAGEPVAAAAAHWNGTTWSAVPTDVNIAGAGQTQLAGISADGAGNVWASGYADNVNGNNFRVPYVLHWTGTKFVMTTVPNPHIHAGNVGGEGSLLEGIQVLSPTDAWVVGATFGLDGEVRTLTEKFDGSAWATVRSPDPASIGGVLIDNFLGSVASAGGGNLFAVGDRAAPKGQCCERTLAIATTHG
jgi:hypothetical protein